MNLEENRLKSLRSWPVQAPITKETLARAGFFYSGNGTEVTCFSCGGKISEWNYGDRAIEKHRRFYPKCEFVSTGAGNITFHSSQGSSNNSFTGQYSNYTGTSNGAGSTSLPRSTDSIRKPELMNLATTLSNLSSNFKIPNSSPTKAGDSSIAYSSNRNTSFANGHSCIGPLPKPTLPTVPTYRAMNSRIENPLKSEMERLRTFEGKWPLSFIKPSDLAQAGFYYLQMNDRVKCVFCDGVLMNWERNDFPMREHARNFPLCPYVLSYNFGNIPKNPWDVPAVRERVGKDLCGIQDIEMRYSGPENKKNVLEHSQRYEELNKWGVNLHEGPFHASQAIEAARLRSFSSWPISHIIKPEDLAAAGFFYIGISDHTKCFYCDGGLCNWEVGDDPWTEHARWFANCTYLKLNKGEDFIKAALASTLSTQQPTAVPPVISAIHNKVDEVMASNMLQAFLAARRHEPDLIRSAVLELVREKGVGPKDLDELTEMIHQVKEEERKRRVPVQSPVEEERSLSALLNIKERKSSPEEHSSSLKSLSPVTIAKEEPEDTPGGAKANTVSGECSANLALEEENRLLKEQRMCKICMDQEVGIVFLPCGHLISCPQCATAMKDCALCRTPIKGTIRTFLS